MKYFFFVVMMVHGLIHVLGFVKAFGWLEVGQLTQSISRQAGVVWFAAAIMFLVAAILYLFDQEYWWMLGTPAVLVSQTMIFLSWNDAKYGTIATIIVLLPLVISIANALPGSFRDIYESEAREGIKRLTNMPPVTESDILHLPAPVQRYLRYAGVIGKPIVQNFRATFNGQIHRTMESGWMDFSARQYEFFDQPTRIFFIESSTFGIPFDGLHLYRGKNATMQIKVASLFEVADAKGDTMTKGETVTLFNDMCIMAPATLIESSVRWESIDSSKARGFFTNAGFTISAVLYFNEVGQLIDFSSDDRYLSSDGLTYKNYPWTTPIENYEDFGGRNVATQAELIWHMPEGDYVYGRFNLETIEYNCREFR